MVTTFLPNIIVRLWSFLDAEGQLTPQSENGSGENLNSFKLLWLSSLPARMTKIRSLMKAQKSGINIIHRFFRRSRADREVGDSIPTSAVLCP